jgi:RNA polymerase sigma-70 factor (ECF subfamily)
MAAPSSPSDNELILLIQQGKVEAFNILYERYLPAVYGRVRYTVPEADIEDVTQEVFIAVMRSLKNFRGDSQFSTWLRTLVNRQVADYYRKRKPDEAELDPGESGLIGTPNPGAHHQTASSGANLEEILMLRQALRQLPENHREVILLRFAEGLQFNEIAAAQGQSLEAVKSLFRRAIVGLQKQMGYNNE